MKRYGLLGSLLWCVTTYSTITNWHNWAKNQQCFPKAIVTPAGVKEVQELLATARREKAAVRFVGSGHSWSDVVLVPHSGYLVNTDKFNHILSIDKEKCQVRAEGGIKLTELFKQIAQHGLAVSNQGYISEQTLAGATATATHGSGRKGSISDFVVSVELIDAQGNLVVISPESHPEWLPAARAHLGALGFVYAVTLQCEPLFVLTHARQAISWDMIYKYYQQLYNTNDYCMFMGSAHSETLLLYRWNRTHHPVTNNTFNTLLERILMSRPVNEVGIASAHYAPRWISKLTGLFFKLMHQGVHREYSYITLSPLTAPVSIEQYYEEEHAIAIENFVPAVKEARALCRKYETQGSNLVSVITCRFCPGEKLTYLGQNYGRTTAYITVNTMNNFKDCILFYKELNELMRKYDGRPHWGKLHYLTKADVDLLYGDNAAQFNAIRKQLDPTGLFANAFIKRCFGD